jgi:hypothetical protein
MLTGDDVADINKALAQPPIFDGPAAMKSDGSYQPAASLGVDRRGRCGAYIEAIYRPLYSVYSTASGSTYDERNSFDYVDPQFTPCSRTINVGDSLQTWLNVGNASDHHVIGSGGIKTDTWEEFTIRRVMCPRVPWKTISCLQNRINGQKAWKPANMTLDGLENNTFPKGTLRFDYAEVTPHVMPTCQYTSKQLILLDGVPSTQPMRCYDILLHFSWRTTYDAWWDVNGNAQAPSPLSWNVEWFNGYDATFTIKADTMYPGWYEAYYRVPTDNPNIWGVGVSNLPKYLNAEDSLLPINQNLPAGTNHPFDALFLNTTP